MALVIGLTGSIATGKTTACQLLTKSGAVHCDADKLVHTLYEPGKPAFDRIVTIFGDEVVGDDGYIDRKILGSKVFGNSDEMEKLTSAIGNIGEAVKEVVEEWRRTLAQNDVVLLEAVNLIEAGYGQWCDQVWLFACDEHIAKLRLMERNGMSEEDAAQRLSSQRHWEERAPASDRVIFNNGTQEELIDKIAKEFEGTMAAHEKGNLAPSKYHGWWSSQRRGSAS